MPTIFFPHVGKKKMKSLKQGCGKKKITSWILQWSQLYSVTTIFGCVNCNYLMNTYIVQQA